MGYSWDSEYNVGDNLNDGCEDSDDDDNDDKDSKDEEAIISFGFFYIFTSILCIFTLVLRKWHKINLKD